VEVVGFVLQRLAVISLRRPIFLDDLLREKIQDAFAFVDGLICGEETVKRPVLADDDYDVFDWLFCLGLLSLSKG
jgi:hypothetical protein